MRKYLLTATGAALLAGSGVAVAQMASGGHDGPQDQRPERGGMMHRMHPRGDGAAFRLRRGDAEMDIRCLATESVQACVTAAGSLMEKVSGMQQPKAQ